MSLENQIHSYNSLVFIDKVDYIQFKELRNIITAYKKCILQN